ncbi:MAG: fused response regulator/phosphatase [Rhodomicrobium sp.]
MILFEETRPATLQDVRWLGQNLGRRLEDSCLRSIDPKLGANSLSLSGAVQAVTEIAARMVQNTTPKPTFLSLEVQIVGSALRVEFRHDGGHFKNCGQVPESGGQSYSQSLTDMEYYPGSPNRLIGWQKLRKTQPHVLIIARDAELRSSLRSMLRQNYETSCAKSAAEAQVILSNLRADAILADYDPAYHHHNIFKAQFDESPIPVILTAWPNEFEEFRRFPFYIDQCLQKPVSTFALVTAIEIAISSNTRRLIHLANHFGRSAGLLLAGELPSQFPGLKLEVLSGTASNGGGDFALALEGKGFTRLILADIMGHGLKAKAGAIALSSIIRTLHRQAGMPAGKLLQSTSHIIADEPAFADLISTIIAVDVRANGCIEVASAGHPPVAIVSSGQSHILPVSGPIPGLLPNPVHPVVKYQLKPGDKFAIVTDGIDSQSAATGEFPGRLLKQLSKNHDLPVSQLKSAVEKWLARRLGPSPKDDWTLVVGEYCGKPVRASHNRPAAKKDVASQLAERSIVKRSAVLTLR